MKTVISSIFLIFCCNLVSAGFFSIIGPRTVQFREKFKVFLSTTNYDDEDIVEISLIGSTNEEHFATYSKKLGNMNQEVEFDLSRSLTIQNFKLTAEIKKENFMQSVDIYMIPKRYSVFIQTDKPVYKPGDTIKFRVLIVDLESKPYQHMKKLIIEIVDGLTNTVKTFDDDEIEWMINGVYESEIKISSDPATGTWKVKVITNDVSMDEDDDVDEKDIATELKIEVKEYVLPRFEVIVDTSHDVTKKDVFVRLKVGAKYTFDEFVVGTAKLTATVYDSKYMDIVQRTATKTVSVETTKVVDFNIINDLQISNEIRPYEVKFEVEFKETLTGQKATKIAEVRIHKTANHTIEFTRERKRFKPGFPYSLKATLKDFDGTTSQISQVPLQLTINYFYKAPLCSNKDDVNQLIKTSESKRTKLLKRGVAEYDIEVPANTTALKITADFIDIKADLSVLRYESKSREYLVMKTRTTTSPKIGKKVKIEVKGNGEWPQLYSIVIGRTGILHQKSHKVKNNKLNFEFVATKWMAPSCSLIVYYIHSTGDIVYDRMKLEFDSSFENMLDLKLTPVNSKPGSNCTISGKSTPNSSIYLLGVDQSVTLLGLGNDIDHKRFNDDMNSYNANENYPTLVIQGNEDRYLELGESNAFILTNALSEESGCLIETKSGGKTDNTVTDDEDESGLYDDTFDDEVNSDKPPIRKNFPETWIFENLEASNTGEFSMKRVLPDTITSFLVSGFSVHPDTGLGIAVQQKVTVFLEFFIKLFLPYSIRLGEVLKVDVSVFNYIPVGTRPLTVSVSMMNDEIEPEFEFVTATQSGNICYVTVLSTQMQKTQTQTVTVHKDSGSSTFFLIRALKSGSIKIKVRASTDTYEDEVERMMLVENEGMKISGNEGFLADLTNKRFDSKELTLSFAEENVIKKSIVIEASVIGDLLGPALKNVHSLLKMPTGCNEQKFKAWIPNIAAINYLKGAGKLTPSYEAQARSYMDVGYQNLVAITQSDGSFSTWTESTSRYYKKETAQEKIWLTAYIAKLLGHAKEFMPIDDKILVRALNFISSKQNDDGSFPDLDNTYYRKTDTQQGVPLTAFIVIAISENKVHKASHKATIDRSLNYIDTKLSQLNDNFAIAIASYALALNNHPETSSYIRELIENAIVRDGKMFWYRERKSLQPGNSPSINVEIAAYALMALIAAGRSVEALPIMKWLMTQRNDAGGFYSTTDTVVGLQALGMIAKIYHTASVNMNVKFSYEKNRTINFNINPQNAMTLQYKDMEQDALNFNVNAVGTGFAYIQVAYQYNINLAKTARRFVLTVIPLSVSNPNTLHLEICARYVPEPGDVQSQMTLIEVFLPSGYVYDPVTADLVASAGVRKIETQSRNTVIVLYFDTITETKVCPQVKAIRNNIVAEMKQSVVKIYDYNNQNHQASAFYLPSGDKPCGF